MLVLTNQNYTGISTVALSWPVGRRQSVFIDATVYGFGIPLWRSTTAGRELARATSTAREIGNGMTGELPTISIERF